MKRGQVRTLRTLTALFVVYIWAIAALYAHGECPQNIGGHCDVQPKTLVKFMPEFAIVRRGNFVVAATTDGMLCYGTR